MNSRLTLTNLLVALLITPLTPAGGAASGDQSVEEKISTVRRITPGRERGRRRPEKPRAVGFVRSIDGSGNHPTELEMNAADTPLGRVMPSDYADGSSEMAGADGPSARLVSNLVCDQPEGIPNTLGSSDFLWQWGQFVDHDIDLTDGIDPPELAPIAVPSGDLWFDPDGQGDVVIGFNRSIYDHGAAGGEPREQLNEITGWIDASNVYGSDAQRATALRTLDGSGRLRMGEAGLLPDDDTQLGNATGGSAQLMFLAGDVRANEQVALTAMHTLFVREHNRIADAIRRREPRAGGDLIYERARRYVGALMQAITFREFLPALLGRGAIAPYRGYDTAVDARIANSFSAAAYRFGHSALSPTLQRLDAKLDEIAEGSLALRDAFFSPDRIRDEGGIEPLLRGLAHQRHQRIDASIIDDVRNFLFGLPGSGGFDLAALNLQRGRDHGLPSYALARAHYGLPAAWNFADLSRDPEVQARLAAAYGTVADVDLWVGGLSEDPLPGGHLGALFTKMIAKQFEALRDGDRFWYEWSLPQRLVRQINATRLSDVIRRNTRIRGEIPNDVFHVRARPERRERAARRR